MAIASFLAGEAISAGDVVFISNSGQIYKSSSVYFTQAAVAGVALDSAIAGSQVRINCDHIYVGYSGLVPGEFQYVDVLNSGRLATYSTWVNGLLDTSLPQAFLAKIGVSVSSSGLSIEREIPLLISNPSEVVLLDSSSGIFISSLTLENSSKINLESAP
jgi:hypothetical protein